MGSINIGQFLADLMEKGIISVTQMMTVLGLFNVASENTGQNESTEYANGYDLDNDHDDSLEHDSDYDLDNGHDDFPEHANGYDLDNNHDDFLEHDSDYDLDNDHDDFLEHANGYNLENNHDESLEHDNEYDFDNDHDESLEHANRYDLDNYHDESLEHANGNVLYSEHDDVYEYLDSAPYLVSSNAGYSELSDDRFDQFKFELSDGEFADGDLVDSGETLINKFELGRRGWKLDELDFDESLGVQVYGNEAFIVETEMERGSIEFKVYSDLDGDRIWTEVIEGELYSANSATNSIDLVGLVESGVVDPLMLGIGI